MDSTRIPPQRNDLQTRSTALRTQQTPSRRRTSSSTSPIPSPPTTSHTRNPSTSSTTSNPSNPSTSSTTSSPTTQDEELTDLTHALKSTLTSLLNCPTVKSDAERRSWCQARLMDAELELKRQRRRRVSSGGTYHYSGSVAGREGEERDARRRESW